LGTSPHLSSDLGSDDQADDRPGDSNIYPDTVADEYAYADRDPLR
jgi:hypothetical protein